MKDKITHSKACLTLNSSNVPMSATAAKSDQHLGTYTHFSSAMTLFVCHMFLIESTADSAKQMV